MLSVNSNFKNTPVWIGIALPIVFRIIGTIYLTWEWNVRDTVSILISVSYYITLILMFSALRKHQSAKIGAIVVLVIDFILCVITTILKHSKMFIVFGAPHTSILALSAALERKVLPFEEIMPDWAICAMIGIVYAGVILIGTMTTLNESLSSDEAE